MSATFDSTQACASPAASRRPPPTTWSQRLEQLNAIGASLSAERDINRLLEAILAAAKTITRADGGTLYRVTEDKTLRFEIVRTSSLKYYLGGTTGNPVPFYPIQLYKDGKPNHSMVAALRGAHRQDGQHRRRVHRRGLRLHRHARLRREDRLPLEVLPHRADEEPRGRDHRRAAAASTRSDPRTGEIVAVLRRPTSGSPSRSPRRRRSR